MNYSTYIGDFPTSENDMVYCILKFMLKWCFPPSIPCVVLDAIIDYSLNCHLVFPPKYCYIPAKFNHCNMSDITVYNCIPSYVIIYHHLSLFTIIQHCWLKLAHVLLKELIFSYWVVFSLWQLKFSNGYSAFVFSIQFMDERKWWCYCKYYYGFLEWFSWNGVSMIFINWHVFAFQILLLS